MLTGWTLDWAARDPEVLPATLPGGPWDNFIVNLGYGGRCLETGHAFLRQDLQMGN